MTSESEAISKIDRIPYKYLASPEVYDRLLEMGYGQRYSRSANTPGFVKIGEREAWNSGLDKLLIKKEDYRSQFKADFIDKLSPESYTSCSELFKYWVDGKTQRIGGEIQKLKSGIKDYILYNHATSSVSDIKVKETLPSSLESPLSRKEISCLIQLTWDHLSAFLQDWIDVMKNGSIGSTNDFYVHRGLRDITPAQIQKFPYKEVGYLTSYSLSLTVAELFAQKATTKRAIVSTPLNTFYERCLFCSFFWQGFDADQLEVLVIPSIEKLYCKQEGLFGDVYEYELVVRE